MYENKYNKTNTKRKHTNNNNNTIQRQKNIKLHLKTTEINNATQTRKTQHTNKSNAYNFPGLWMLYLNIWNPSWRNLPIKAFQKNGRSAMLLGSRNLRRRSFVLDSRQGSWLTVLPMTSMSPYLRFIGGLLGQPHKKGGS